MTGTQTPITDTTRTARATLTPMRAPSLGCGRFVAGVTVDGGADTAGVVLFGTAECRYIMHLNCIYQTSLP